MAESPAAKVIRLLGAKRVAAKCDLTTDAVWKWRLLNAGTIPSRHQLAIYELAKEQGVALSPAEIIGLEEPAP